MSPASSTILDGIHDKASTGAEGELSTGSPAIGNIEHEGWSSTELSQAMAGIEGDFLLDEAVVESMDKELNLTVY